MRATRFVIGSLQNLSQNYYIAIDYHCMGIKIILTGSGGSLSRIRSKNV